MMRLTDSQMHRLADALLDSLLQRGGAQLKQGRAAAQVRIEETIRQNLATEMALEKEAEKLLAAQVVPPSADRQSLLLMIKKKLAEQKGFPL
jgi:hypothetical protein